MYIQKVLDSSVYVYIIISSYQFLQLRSNTSVFLPSILLYMFVNTLSNSKKPFFFFNIDLFAQFTYLFHVTNFPAHWPSLPPITYVASPSPPCPQVPGLWLIPEYSLPEPPISPCPTSAVAPRPLAILSLELLCRLRYSNISMPIIISSIIHNSRKGETILMSINS